ncbi:MAG: hypothetical protein QM756_32620 [Polyangiaceae bacterium]
MAMVTGDVDALECVLRKVGVADSEFTLPTGTGRIHMYRSNGGLMGCTNYNNNGQCRTSGMIKADLSGSVHRHQDRQLRRGHLRL